MINKKSPHFADAGKNQIRDKDKHFSDTANTFHGKKYLVNMPKKLGLSSGKKYYFIETQNGYSLNFGRGLWIGMPKVLIENNPHLYTLVQKGGQFYDR